MILFRDSPSNACEPGDVDLAELLTMPGVREECILRSNVGFMALHGGSQDRGTAEIAALAAEEADVSYYAIVQPFGLRVHLTSRLHDPDHSAEIRARGHCHLSARVRARWVCALDRTR